MKDVKKFTDSSFGGNEEFRALEWSAHSPHCRADLTGQVMDELDEYFSTRAITYISGQRELLRDTVRLMLARRRSRSRPFRSCRGWASLRWCVRLSRC